MRRALSRPPRPGYTLIAVLIVVVVLSLAAYRFSDAMTSEYRVAVRTAEAAQARTFAASGVHYAAGLLADPDTLANRLGGNPYDAPDVFVGVPLSEGGTLGGGRFTVVSAAGRYGVTDEAGKLNVNALIQFDPTGQQLRDTLIKLPNMTEEIADAIVDWVDSDDTARAAGAEASHYAGLNPPYLTKNGPLNSVEELLLVRGVTPQLLLGNDRNRNGVLDPGEEDGGDANRGWSDFLTVYGRELNADAAGSPRIDLTGSDLRTLSEQLTAVLGQELSDYILAARLYGTSSTQQSSAGVPVTSSSGAGSSSAGSSGTGSPSGNSSSSGGGSSSGRGASSSPSGSAAQSTSSSQSSGSGQNTVTGGPSELNAAVQNSLNSNARARNRLNSVLSLVNTRVTLPKPRGSPQNTPTTVVNSPLNDPAQLKELLPLLLEHTTTRRGFEMTPRVNVNTAPFEVLMALPGMDQSTAASAVAAREGLDPLDPATTTGAWLVTQAGMTADKFRALEPYVTGRTMTYRVHALGYFAAGGPVARAEAVVDTNQGKPRVLYFRDLTDLGRGFEPPR